MTDSAIAVENLGKRYRIGRAEQTHDTLIGTLNSWVRSPLKNFRKLRSLSRFDDDSSDDVVWALQNVSFEIARGEVVGVIGPNGAGKSTLLKILSRITDPTEGRAIINGRVSSLLEVGTGFHSELTGRENIYLNGTVLGMSKAEVDRKFDEIVAFSGVERFLDTPVKRYSSGMRVRLAFAVAAHLEPDILLIDEVLAVGDVGFQKKCLGKMGEVAGQGRTILFVSHDMAAIQHLCARTIYLKNGRVQKQGQTPEVITSYLAQVDADVHTPLVERDDRRGNGAIRFIEASLEVDGKPANVWRTGSDVSLHLGYKTTEVGSARDLTLDVGIDNEFGVRIAHLSNETLGQRLQTNSDCKGTITIHLERLPLMPGRYVFTLFATVSGETADWLSSAIKVEVEAGDYYESGRLPPNRQGLVLVDYCYKSMTQEVSTASTKPAVKRQ